jgi:hypothetical protein
MKEFVTIFTAKLTRQLLKEGYTLSDIKLDKNDHDRKKKYFRIQKR